MKELLNEQMTRAAHELDMARMERINRRQFIVILILILVCVGSNAGWLYYESQFMDEVTTTTVTQDVDSGDGGNAIINDGVKINGESKTDSSKNN